jgi:hypothetical protein
MPDTPQEKREAYNKRVSDGLCAQCGKQKATDGVLCEYHGKIRSKTNKDRRRAIIKHKHCIDCKSLLDDNRVVRCSKCLLINATSSKKLRMSEGALEKARDRRARIKDEVFNAYGGWSCACCGNAYRDMLSLDHIKGGGGGDRRRFGHGHAFYSYLRAQGFPAGYKILCMNCNFSKRYSGVCPHETENKFVVTTSGLIGANFGTIDVEKAAPALGKLCRYAGNCRTFWTVLLHSLVVCDLAPDRIKLLALVHDISETAISDIPSPFKNAELEHVEKKIQGRLFSSLCLKPTKQDFIDLKIADRRALSGEVWTVAADELRKTFPIRDPEAEIAVMKYVQQFLPQDSHQADGRAVIEFIRRFRDLQNKEK